MPPRCVLSAQEGQEVYECEGAGTAHQILQYDEGHGDGENTWAPLELSVMGTVAGIHNPTTASPAATMNERTQRGNREQENAGGGSTNGGSTSVPPTIAAAGPMQNQQADSHQEGWSELMVDVARAGAVAKPTNFL